MSNKFNVTEVVQALDDEPLTHLMLGHRELFHSNLLAWFFTKFPNEFDQVFGSLTTKANNQTVDRGVRREKKHFDLWFEWPDREPLVVENKVFSLPDEKQLERYSIKATNSGQEIRFFLLSLIDPNWVDDQKTIGNQIWHWLSYKKLGELIRSSMDATNQSYAVATMVHYAKVVDLLAQLVRIVVVNDNNEKITMPENLNYALQNSRLKSPLEKLRWWSIAQRVSESLREANIRETYVESGLTNATPLNSWFIDLDAKLKIRVGWQLQGRQFRLAIITPHLSGRDEHKKQDRANFAHQSAELFEFSYLEDLLGKPSSVTMPLKSGFCHYSPDFVYRYRVIPPDFSVAQLQAIAVAVAERLIPYALQASK